MPDSPMQSDFEKKFDFAPLGDDIAARVDRMEEIFGGFLETVLKALPSTTYVGSHKGIVLPPRDRMEKLFDPFRRAEDIRRRRDQEAALEADIFGE